MFKKIKKLWKLLHNKKLLRMLLSMESTGYLNETGWIASFNQQMPVDTDNNPLPWTTYPFIDFICDRLNPSMNTFEYGAGNSTLWYADKVKSVTSIEHDSYWFNKIKNNMPRNVSIFHTDLIYGGDYCRFANSLSTKFDIIIIDGRDRVNCIKNSIECLTECGIIILDDSERESYIEGINHLLNHGFKKIDFWGISPGLFYKKNTTIFYRTDNCIGI